jgi:Ni/Fe-hydrogenase subunit HybB-like protein
MSQPRAAPVGGKLFTPFFKVLVAVWAVGSAFGLVRFTQGLGASTAMNDGYPWGIWIAVDVVVGTALGSGGFAVALLIYFMNRRQLHPLMRPALLTSALGYTAGATAIVFDVGRYWNLWRVPIAPLAGGRFYYNWTSGLLEVALCVMAYTAVLWLEVAPPVLETLGSRPGALGRISQAVLRPLEKALPLVLALGLVLPVMHQSTLGSLLMVAGTKLHKLWHSPLLPLLFLLGCVGMGYAAVVAEAAFSARAFGRPLERRMLASLAPVMSAVAALFAVVRLGDVVARGRLGLALAADRHAALFWAEVLLAAAAAVLLASRREREDMGALLRAAGLLAVSGALYRLDVYLVAFDPGNGWRYFPSVGEICITLGIMAVETMIYIYAVRRFPFLTAPPTASTGAAAPPRPPAPLTAS